jgi:hypothetical protein
MKKKLIPLFFLIFIPNLMLRANGLNAINDPVMNPCIQRPYLSGCGGNNQSEGHARRIINIPNRWGAIYFNPANRVIGYSENNTEGYHSANKEALESCIRAGGGANPIARDGKGCRLMIKYRNVCAAAAVGGQEGTGGYAMKNADSVKEAEEKALAACGKYSNECTIRYSGCSRHPDYLRY